MISFFFVKLEILKQPYSNMHALSFFLKVGYLILFFLKKSLIIFFIKKEKRKEKFHYYSMLQLKLVKWL